MFQLRPTIKLKIDQLSSDQLCCHLLLWAIFFFVLLIMSATGPKLYVNDHIAYPNCIKSTSDIQCQFCYLYDVSSFQLEFFFDLNYVNRYFLYNYFQHELLAHGINVPRIFNQETRQILPKYNYKLTTLVKSNQSLKCPQYSNFSSFPNLNDSEIEMYNQQNCHLKQNYQGGIMQFECFHPDPKKLLQTSCSSADFVEVETENMKEFLFLLRMDTQNYTEGFDNIKIITHYQNNRYYPFTLFFKLMFLLMVMISLIIYYFKITQFPYELWLQVHKWISLLMFILFLYDLPFEILRYINAPLIQEFFSQLIYLILQSALYYFWLSNFELLHRKIDEEQSVSTKWTIFKISLISLYTIPQALMSFYIFLKKESKSEFDPRSEIFFYPYYIKVKKDFVQNICQIQFGLLLIYTIVFLRLSMKFLKKELPSSIEVQHEQHDPFAQENNVGQEVKKQREQTYNFETLQMLSIITFTGHALLQTYYFLNPFLGSALTAISEQALLNIYVLIISIFYAPYQKDEDNLQDDASKQDTKNIYGEIELEDQNKLGKKEQEDRDKLWKNIQKQMEEEQNQDNEDDSI